MRTVLRMTHHTIRSFFGGRVRVIAQPMPAWTSGVVGAFSFAHRVTEWAARRWAPRFYPLIRLLRIVSLLMIACFAWAGAGIRCLRIGNVVYVNRRWFNINTIIHVRGPGAPHPMYREPATTIVLRGGRVVQTDVDLHTVHTLLGIGR